MSGEKFIVIETIESKHYDVAPHHPLRRDIIHSIQALLCDGKLRFKIENKMVAVHKQDIKSIRIPPLGMKLQADIFFRCNDKVCNTTSVASFMSNSKETS